MREDTSIQEKELIPIRLVQAVGALLLVTLLMVGYARLSDMPLIGTPKQAPVVSQTTLEFVKKENGSVSIYNNKGEEIINSRGGPYGFIVVVYNGFMSERKKKKIETIYLSPYLPKRKAEKLIEDFGLETVIVDPLIKEYRKALIEFAQSVKSQ